RIFEAPWPGNASGWSRCLDDRGRGGRIPSAPLGGVGSLWSHRFHPLSGHVPLPIYGGEFLGQAAAQERVRWVVSSHRWRGGAGFRDRHSLLSCRLHLVAFIGWDPQWFDVAAVLLDYRTLDRHLSHLGAHRPRDSKLVS